MHENSDIWTTNKFNYLNSLFEGNAARTVHGLDAAVEMLQERYGKPQIIISEHMDEILKIQSSKEYGSLLIPIIMSKRSSDVRLQILQMKFGKLMSFSTP